MKKKPVIPPAKLAVLVAAVLAAHVLLLETAPSQWHTAPVRSTQAFVTRRLPTQVVGGAPTPPTPPAPAVAAKPASPAPALAPQRPPPAAQAAPEPPPAAPAEAPAPPPAPATPQPPGAAAFDPQDALTQAPPPEPQVLAIPEPARLNYEVSVDRMGLTLRSTAHLSWRHDGTLYDAQLEVGGGLYPRRVQRSTGQITAEGLAPQRFTDKSRSEQATHFVREQGRIVFSNNKPESPLPPGVQDRLSVIVQLAALLASAPAKYPQGSTITLPVAGTSDVDTWVFSVEGEEDLHLPGGDMKGLKLQRLPRKEYDIKVELWFAPRLDYAPVRLRLTNPNGESADQRWSGTDRP